MAKKVERSFDGDRVGLNLEQLVDRFELLVDLSRRLGVALSERADHGLALRPVDADVVRLTRQLDGMSRGVRAGVGDNGAAPAERVDRNPEQLEPLIVGEGGTLAGRSGDDEPIGTTLDEVLREFAEALEVDRSV